MSEDLFQGYKGQALEVLKKYSARSERANPEGAVECITLVAADFFNRCTVGFKKWLGKLF